MYYRQTRSSYWLYYNPEKRWSHARGRWRYTATKIPFMYSQKRNCAASQFPHLCFCERFIYSQDRSTYFPAAEQTDRLWEYINCTHTHECGIRLGLRTGNFCCWEYLFRQFSVLWLCSAGGTKYVLWEQISKLSAIQSDYSATTGVHSISQKYK
jgi:hypothetical protein